jgi:hypothetical protein
VRLAAVAAVPTHAEAAPVARAVLPARVGGARSPGGDSFNVSSAVPGTELSLSSADVTPPPDAAENGPALALLQQRAV